MPQAVTAPSLPQAFGVIKEMQRGGGEGSEDDRGAGRKVVAEAVEGGMVMLMESRPLRGSF